MLGPIVVGTVTVADLDEATRWYVEWLGYETWESGILPEACACAWGAPRAANSPYRILGPGPGRPGGVRLIQRPVQLDASPLRVAGWRSLELGVRDTHAVRQRLAGSPFAIVGEPKGLETNPSIVAMQVVGPGREMLYLTQTVQDSQFELPIAERFVDRMFIAVLSAPDLPSARAFYATLFDARGGLSLTEVALEAVNSELGSPVDRRHAICALQLDGRSLIEIDAHPAELADLRPPAGDLAGGLAAVSFQHPDLDDAGIAPLLLTEPETHAEAPYLGRRTAALRGPASELIELIEGAAA